MNEEMIPAQTSPAPTPTAPAPTLSKNGKPIGRPRKDRIADTLSETLRQIDTLLLLDNPSPAKSRLLQSKLEYYTLQQKREDERKSNRIELERARMQNTLDKAEIELLKKQIQEMKGTQ